MNKDIETVRRFYDQGAEQEWLRLESHPFEFILTTWMMDKYIRPGDTILDIGGGPGRYSIHYAKKGCHVVLADLSEGNIAFARRKAEEEAVPLTVYAKNCLELDELPLEQYDHVFLMGPLYHLMEEDERVRAVELALKHLRPGGKLYVSFIMVIGGVLYDLQHAGQIIVDRAMPEADPFFDAVAEGRDFPNRIGFTTNYMYHQRNILPFMDRFGLEKLHFFGQEGILAPNYRDLLARSPEEIALWVELAKKYLEVPELLAYSEHAMYIGQKP
ncbi:MAG: class I SAM-dependent methyltransferase [Oscillospiraceae bacterium]|nr:class I SAM-dependent methyltransferase [Oscillospiraceae bacterium]